MCSLRLLLDQLLWLILCRLEHLLLLMLGLVLQGEGHEQLRPSVLSLHGLRWLGVQLFLLRVDLLRLGDGEGVE